MKKTIQTRENVDDSHLPSHLHPVIKQIYATRNVSHADELNNSAATLHDFKLFKDMDKACDLLIEALHAQSHILIVGDFDADGCNQYRYINARLGHVWLCSFRSISSWIGLAEVMV